MDMKSKPKVIKAVKAWVPDSLFNTDMECFVTMKKEPSPLQDQFGTNWIAVKIAPLPSINKSGDKKKSNAKLK